MTQHYTAHEPARPAVELLAAAGLSPVRLEQYKRDRLIELRAVVDSLRVERGGERIGSIAALRLAR